MKVLDQFVTPQELAQRWKGEIAEGTLANWRSAAIGPKFIRKGRMILYLVKEIETFEKKKWRSIFQ